MSDGASEFCRLMEQIRQGSEEASREFLERYGPHILRVVRRQMSGKLRSRFDSADFLQAVWTSFFALDLEQCQFDRAEALVAYLVRMARNKVNDAYRPLAGVTGREKSLDNSAVLAEAEQTHRPETPSQFAVAQEQWQALVAEQSEQHQRILEMLRLGHTHAEIAEALGVNEKTVRRLVRRALSRLVS